MAVLTHIDLPVDGVMRAPAALIQGWIASNEQQRFEHLSLVNAAGTVVPLGTVDRPDVRTAKPEYASTGFGGWIDIRENGNGPWRLRYEDGSGTAAETALALRAMTPTCVVSPKRKRASFAHYVRCCAARRAARRWTTARAVYIAPTVTSS